MFQRLLIPVEFGGLTRDVARFATKLAAPGADARLIHVLERSTATVHMGYEDGEALATMATEALERLVEDFGTQMHVDFEIRQGTVYESVLEAIDAYEPDAVVMGSHGRRGLPRLLLGSDVERVLRQTTVPLCVAKGRMPESEKLEQIALVTDLTATTRRATQVFMDLLRASGAKGRLVHVMESEVWGAMQTTVFGASGALTVPDIDAKIQERIEERRRESQRKLVDHAARMCDDGLKVVHELIDGDPALVVDSYVEREQIDLVILGSHHYRGLDRMLNGSIAEKVLRTAHCPVLIVPRAGDEVSVEGSRE